MSWKNSFKAKIIKELKSPGAYIRHGRHAEDKSPEPPKEPQSIPKQCREYFTPEVSKAEEASVAVAGQGHAANIARLKSPPIRRR